MPNPITVSSIAYMHTEDIDSEQRIDANQIDSAMNLATARALNALTKPTGDYSQLQRFSMRSCLQSAVSTHSAIRKVMAWGERNPESVDALALARLPLETLYNMCMFTENSKWIDRYVHDGWKKQYEEFLLQSEETKELKRFEDFSKKTARQPLITMANAIGITPEQIATIHHQQLGEPMPSGMSKSKILRFPTPARAIAALSNGSKRRMLQRLYYEYIFFCSFIHGLPSANLFKMMFRRDSEFDAFWSDQELQETFRKEVSNRAYITSLVSILQSVTEITVLYSSDLDLMAGITKAWQDISRNSLLPKAIWNLRTRKLLRILK